MLKKIQSQQSAQPLTAVSCLLPHLSVDNAALQCTPAAEGRGRTLRHEQVDVVAADKVLRHAHDRALQALLAVVVGRVLRYVP